MENEHLRVVIAHDGTLSVTHKATGAVFAGLNRFEDSGEAGMAWMHMKPGNDRVIDSRGCPVTVAIEENGPLLARFRVDVHMPVPARLDENGGDAWKRLDGVGNDARRTDETVPMTITSVVTLRAGERAVEVETRFDNRARSHRLRALFPTRLDTVVCHAESAFDVVEREVVFGPDSPWAGSPEVTSPMQRFVDVSDGRTGLAIVNDGLREYEVTQGEERAIAVTLLRAYEVSLSTVSKRWDIHPEMGLAQCPGTHVFRYRILPHAGAWDTADVYGEVERLALPLLPAQTGAHAGNLPQRGGFLEVSGDNVVLSALKQADDGEGLVVRVFNPAAAATRATLSFSNGIRRAERLTLEELPDCELQPDGSRVSLDIAPKKIVTLRVVLE
jgi:alpha-mannosidase